MAYFVAPANKVTHSPVGDIPVFFPEETRCVQCRVCHEVWVDEPPQGHACYAPMDPKLAWPA